MKATKKLLSVLLAVIMIMTSMSVCFGTVSFAAGGTATDAQWNALANALANDTVKNATFSGEANDYTVADPDGKILAAVEAYYDVFNAIANKSPATGNPNNTNTAYTTGSGEGNRTINQVNTSIKNELSSRMGGNYTTYNVATFLGNLVCGANVSSSTGNEQKKGGFLNNDKNVPSSNLSAISDIKLTVTAKLTDYKIKDLPDTLITSKTFTVKHTNSRYDYKYSSSWGTTNRYYKFYYNISENAAETVNSSVDTSVLKAADTVFNTTYADYSGVADVAAVLALSKDASALQTVLDAFTAQRTSVTNKYGEAIFDHFFSTGDKDIEYIGDAIVVLGYEPTINAINGYYTADYTRMNKTEIKAHLDAFRASYATFTALGDSAKEIIKTTYNFDPEAVEERIQEVSDRYDTLCVLEYKAVADGHKSEYDSWTVDHIDEGTVTSAMITAALADIARDKANFNLYSDEFIAAVAGEGYEASLIVTENHLKNLGSVAGYNDEFLADYAEFAADIKNITTTDYDKLYNSLKSYDKWYTDFKALIDEMKTELGEEIATKLFDDLNTLMVAHMDAAYAELNTRTEVQINVAYDLYQAHKIAYGANVHYVSLESYNTLKDSIGLIDTTSYNFINNSGNFTVPAETVKKYNELQAMLVKYDEFVATKGFATYETIEIDDIVREEADNEIVREGDYTVDDDMVEDVIDTLEAALANEEIKKVLGSLINKETGESFDIAGLLTSLIEENVYSDALINTIIQFIYPAVANIFTEVWMGINPRIDDPAMDVMGQTVDVHAELYLYTVEAATEGLDLPIFPTTLAKKIDKDYSQFSAVADVLEQATTAAYIAKDANGDWDESTRKSPWDDAVLFTDKIDKDGNVVTDDDGNATQVLNLNWGIDELEGAAKRERFLQAIQAALIGLEPILLALLCNQEMDQFNPKIGTGYGKDGLNNFYVGDVLWWNDVTLSGIELDIHTIDLRLTATANDGYNNALAPLFELLGVAAPDGETFKSTRDVIEKGLLIPLDAVIAKLSVNPIETILDILPNLAYAIEADLLLTKLDYLSTTIEYSAGATINADLNDCTSNVGVISTLLPYLDGVVESMTGLTCEGGIIKNVRCDDVMTDEIPVAISTFLDIGELLGGADLSSMAGIWDFVAGLVPALAGTQAPDVARIALLGTLTEIDTVRSIKDYNWGTNGKAAHIVANRADVLVYLLRYVFGSGILGGLLGNGDEAVSAIVTSLALNPDAAIAGIVELLDDEKIVYDKLREFEWFDGYIDGESVVGNSANEIYLNPGNDWTEEKADYLYNNLDSIVGAVLTLAKLDLDKTTEEVDGSIGSVIGGAVDGLLGDKTLTALAALLAKLDLNALLAPKADAEGEETPDASEPETVAEGDEATEGEAEASALDVNGLVKEFLGIDLAAVAAQYADIAAAVEADPEYVAYFGVDEGNVTFAKALSDMLKPLSPVLDFILAGKNLKVTVAEGKAAELVGYDGYNNAIIPILEALGCTVTANPENALEAVLTALVGKIEAITDSDKPIKAIIDILPGVFYFITSKGLSVSVRNLLQPVYVILDTIRPVYDLDLNALINGLLPEGIMFNIDDIGLETVFTLIEKLVPDVAGLGILGGLKDVIYDICYNVATEYDSASTLQKTWKKGALSDKFSGGDLLTVVLSFVLEWATIEDNAKALDEMLGTDGLIASVGTVFESVEINYGTPDWMYWFETEKEFNSYVEGNNALPNTLNSLTYPNDWSDEAAAYIAANLADLADMVVGLIEIDGVKYESVAALLNNLVYGDFNIEVKAADEENEAIVINYLFSDETINVLLGMLKGVLANIDETLLGAGYILDVDVVGLKNYVCEKEITTIDGFFAELANILDTYAKGLVDLLFFGDDFRLAKKSDKTDTIVINGGLGYEKGLALVLEALGCTLPEEATVASVLGSLASRVEAILANPVEEVIDLLPNLVYFLNANGAGVAVDNLLQPVYAIIDKLAVFGVELDLADLLGFDLKYLSLADILALVKDKAGLDLSVAEEMLVDLCFGKIEKAEYTYKMVAERGDVITVVLTTALLLIKDEDFAAKLEEMLGTELISAITAVFESAPVSYKTPDWSYAVADNETLEVIDYAITYPNNWTEESAKYIADNLTSIGDMVAGIIDSNYASLGALLSDKVNIYTPETLKAIQKLLGDLIGGLDENLKDLVNVGLGAADALLGADVQGLLDYDVSAVNDKDSFVAALTGMLMEVEGLVDWLLLGEDYKFFVDNDKNDIITINGGHGYANGLALVLEALGVENLPDVYAMEEIDTEKVVKAVLTATFDRVDAIFANPVEEVFDILPNVLYFINANGLGVAVENLLGAVNALLLKLEGLGVELDIASLVNFSDILGVETELTLYNITMADVVKLVSDLTGLNLDKVADVLVGFALGEINVYDSVSSFDYTAKMEYKDEFDKHDMITVLATVAIITLTDEVNADKVKALLGEKVYEVILNLINMGEVPVQEFDWQFTERADTGYVFSAAESSGLLGENTYGMVYTEEMAQYIADNFGEFVNNIIYLLGLDVDGSGETEKTLKELINSFLGGSLYNGDIVITIRDALAGVLANLTELKVNDKVVGGLIADVLKEAEIADLNAVAKVKVDEFDNDREKFVEALCDVLEPLYGILKFVLADEDFSFFVNMEKTDAITLKGAEGYAYGILPLLETLDCKNILAPADYYAAVEADGNVLLTSILNPLLDRVDEILADDPAQAILDMLPNLIYFVNSNGVDTVVKNTLNAVYAVLAAIEPIAKIDLYALIGIDLAEIDFDWLVDKLFEVLRNAGYEFTVDDIDYIAELTVGKLESYTSLNGKTAYKMVYADGESGDEKELVTVTANLVVRFLANETNKEVVLKFLREQLGMTEEVEPYVDALLDLVVDCVTETQLGAETALATIYYVFYGIDTGVDGVANGKKELKDLWLDAFDDLKKENSAAGELIEEILGWEIFEDIFSAEEGFAPNGLIKFFAKIAEWFKTIIEWFKNLFSKTESASI